MSALAVGTIYLWDGYPVRVVETFDSRAWVTTPCGTSGKTLVDADDLEPMQVLIPFVEES